MDHQHRLTPRERLVRIGGGLGLVVLGCVIFAVSQARDPENRWAFIGIAAIIVGFSWAGPGVRGHRDGVPLPGDATPDAPASAASRRPAISAERTVVGLLAAWLVPGLGHWLVGRRRKAVLYFVTITVCFFGGVLLAEGRNLDYGRDGIYFFAYLFNAGETLLGVALTRHLELDHEIPFLHLGFLYTAVASLLNLVAMMDFVSTCSLPVERDAAEPTTAPGDDS